VIVKEACAGWDRVQHVKDPQGSVHGWSVHDEATGELRTDCGLTFLDRGRSPDWQDTQEPLTCGICDELEERSAAEGKA
jgi:hypothetical protein